MVALTLDQWNAIKAATYGRDLAHDTSLTAEQVAAAIALQREQLWAAPTVPNDPRISLRALFLAVQALADFGAIPSLETFTRVRWFLDEAARYPSRD